jgi:hypothetical protein
MPTAANRLKRAGPMKTHQTTRKRGQKMPIAANRRKELFTEGGNRLPPQCQSLQISGSSAIDAVADAAANRMQESSTTQLLGGVKCGVGNYFDLRNFRMASRRG